MAETEIATRDGRGALARAGAAFAAFGLNRPRDLVVWTIVVGTLIRLVTAALYGFGIGESYYLATARHFALSYFDQPPLSLWIAWATLNLTGVESAFVMRLPFIAMFAATTWLMFRFAAILFGERAGALAALLLNLSPVFAGMAGVWMQPDGPLMLFLVATMLLVAKLVIAPTDGRRLAHWAGIGVCLGLALLAKYHAALIVIGVVLFAMTSRSHRRWFRQPGPYLAIAIALVLFTPVLIWNAQNGWVSFGFQGSRITDNAGLNPLWLGRMIVGQIAYIGPWVWLPMIWVFWQALRRGPADPRSWLLACSAIFPVLLFTAASLWAPLGWHFHWQAPGYLMLFPPLGAAAVRWAGRRQATTGWWLTGSAIVTAAVMLVFATQAASGWLRVLVPAALEQRLANVSDPTLEGLDWDELRSAVAEAGHLGTEQTFAVAPQWFVAGKIDVQLGGAMPIICLCDDPRNIAFGWDHTDFTGWDAIIVTPEGMIDDVQGVYGQYFRSIEPLPSVTVLRGGAPAVVLQLHFARSYSGGYPLPLPP